MIRLSLLFILVPVNLFAQQKQDLKLAIYNVGFGGVTAGIGAIINKPKHTDWKKALLKGFWQGAVGGSISYGGKKVIYLVNRNENKFFGWPAKILHSAGSSIIENASLNEPFLQNWNIDLYMVKLNFSTNGKKPFRARFLPESIYSVWACSRYGKFDLNTTLSTGEMAFRNDSDGFSNGNGNYIGMSFGRSYVYTSNMSPYETIAHEIIHNFQYREYQIFNTYLMPFSRSVKSKSLKNLFSRYVYFDIPYFWAAYEIAGRSSVNDYRNFYQFEAQRFATNQYVDTK